ncbi:MAG: hypothetical protein EOO05_04860 [Chitinophagaceae bacterium]|nr:MAG: hypothetical protein EOO05_04860 [Chitinophagaceae bacterium]
MKILLFILMSFLFVDETFSQNVLEITYHIGRKRKVTAIEVAAAVNDADTTRRERIAKRLSSFKVAGKGARRGTYTVLLRYVVSKDGSISDVRCDNDPGYGLCSEAMRAAIVSDVWKPGKQEGAVVRPLRGTAIYRPLDKNHTGVDVEITIGKHHKLVSVKAWIMSSFEGGDSLWLQSFEKQIRQSLMADRRVKKGTYFISAGFRLLEDRSLTDIQCLNGCGVPVGAVVMRVLKKGMVKWQAAGHGVSEVE